MSEYDNMRKCENQCFRVIFVNFWAKVAPVSGLTLHCQNYYVFLKKIEFCSCSLVRNTANTSNREEQGNAHADMPFCGVFHCIIPVANAGLWCIALLFAFGDAFPELGEDFGAWVVSPVSLLGT